MRAGRLSPLYNSASWPLDSHIVRAGVRFRQPRRVAAMKRSAAVVKLEQRGERPQSYNHLIEIHCLHRDCVICFVCSSMHYLMRAAAVRVSDNEDEDGEVSEEAAQLATAAAKRIKKEEVRVVVASSGGRGSAASGSSKLYCFLCFKTEEERFLVSNSAVVWF